jgi:hypothetical protein
MTTSPLRSGFFYVHPPLRTSPDCLPPAARGSSSYRVTLLDRGAAHHIGETETMTSFSFMTKRGQSRSNRKGPSNAVKGTTGLPKMRQTSAGNPSTAASATSSRGTVAMGTHANQVQPVAANIPAVGQHARERNPIANLGHFAHGLKKRV